MRTLIYKRTHPGDPNEDGVFGVHNCMGKIRTWRYDAVIGVGGIGAEPKRHGLDGKVTWIGIGPTKREAPGKRGCVVTFDHFLLLDSTGPSFRILAPQLAKRMYSRNVRVVMDRLRPAERREVASLLACGMNAPPSAARRASTVPSATSCTTPPRSRKPVKGCSR